MSRAHEELLAVLGEQAWIQESSLSVETDGEGRVALRGDVTVTDLEGVEILIYLIADIATLCRETADPALAFGRLHAEVLPASSENDLFRFRLWTDPLPAPSFDRLAAIIREAVELTDEEEDASRNGGFIPLDEL